MKRIALSIAVLGILAVFNVPASASDLSVFLRKLHGGNHYARQHHRQHDELAYRAYQRELAYRAYQRELAYRQAYRAPQPCRAVSAYRQPVRAHDYQGVSSRYPSSAYRPSYGSPYSNGNPADPYGYSAKSYGGGYNPRAGVSSPHGY